MRPEAFQLALDALDVMGQWEWDAATDLVRADAFVALVDNVDPVEAAAGVPLAVDINGVPVDDRERVPDAIQHGIRERSPYFIEHRAISAERRTRWVLARGRYTSDNAGKPVGGSGILIDITQMRISEGTFAGVEPHRH